MTPNTGPCQSCHQAFQPGDDIVICPECGAPYHRACYQKEGRCVYQEKHAAGFEYKPPQPKVEAPPPKKEEAPAAEGGVLCKTCGTVNEKSNIFCEHCGTPLHVEAPPGAPREGTSQEGAPPPGAPLTFEQAYGYQQTTDLTGEIDGIPKADWAAFIGTSAPAYLPRLSLQQRRGGKFGFLFSAFFVSSFYFAYRKMWGWAALALASFVLLNAPGILWILADAGMPLLPGLSQDLLQSISLYTGLLGYVRQILFGVFALYLFRTDAAGKIKPLRKKMSPGPEYQQALRKKGGVSPVGIVVLVVLFFAFSYWLYAYGGDALVNYVYATYGF